MPHEEESRSLFSLKPRARIESSYLAAIVVMLLSLAFVLFAFGNTQQQTARIRRELNQLENANRMIVALEQMENVEFRYFQENDHGKQKGEFERFAADFDEAFSRAEVLAEGSSEKRMLDEIEAGAGVYRRIDARILEALRAGKLEKALSLNLRESMVEADSLRARLRDFQAYSGDKIFRDQGSIDRILSETELWLLAVFLGGAAFAGFLWMRALRVLEELRTLDKMKSDLMSVISHELLTPINFITGFGSALEDGIMGALTPEQLKAVQQMSEGARRLTRLVRKVIDFTQLGVGKLVVLPEETDYASLVEAAISEFRPQAEGKDQTVELSLPEELPFVWADPSRALQILQELLENAGKFTGQQGKISIEVWAEAERVVTEVCDTGVGMPPEAAKSLFKPFQQLDFSSTRRFGGLGIGLALVHQLVIAMNGEITVRSKVGEGSCFRFTLPKIGPFLDLAKS